MNKILLILQREYLTRVKKKSFLIVTFLTPILITAVYAIPALLMFGTDRSKTIEVIDESNLFKNKFKNERDITYKFDNQSLDSAKASFATNGFNALVFIPKNILDDTKGVKIFAEKSVSLELKSNIERTIQNEVRNIKLTQAGIDLKILEENNKLDVDANTYTIGAEGGEKTSSSVAATAVGFFFAFVLYIAVLIYGSQVMMGVIEEKSSRIVEVIISSVKPVELMLGKIIGIGLVGLTQFLLWAVLTFAISTVTSSLLSGKMQSKMEEIQKSASNAQQAQQLQAEFQKENPAMMVKNALDTLPIGQIVFGFFFYFFGGYLLYSSLYAAVGSAVENIQDAQQFSWPLTIPIILSIFLAQFVINEPDSSVAFWASMIPFTSPINMMVRIPFGVPLWELALSMILLVAGFLFTTWLAARIYRVGILMYGKKVNFKELAKWVFYKG